MNKLRLLNLAKANISMRNLSIYWICLPTCQYFIRNVDIIATLLT